MTGVVKKVVVLILFAAMALPMAGAETEAPRKVKSQVQPIVPDIARVMNLTGRVRLEIEIGENGTVKATKALGGHPVLIRSAEEAVRKWRYEPGPPTKTVVEFNFHQD